MQFTWERYAGKLTEMQDMSREEVVAMLKRRSTGFSRCSQSSQLYPPLPALPYPDLTGRQISSNDKTLTGAACMVYRYIVSALLVYVYVTPCVCHARPKLWWHCRGQSKYRGVTRHHQQGRWEARIGRVRGKRYMYLGTFDRCHLKPPSHIYQAKDAVSSLCSFPDCRV